VTVESERSTEAVEPVAARAWPRPVAGYLLLALAAYGPILRSDPGKVAADTKTYLYLDPGRLLARAAYMWDPHIGMGTVTHQNIGYLFPMGPYYWILDKIGVPDWFAQRLWLGSILFFAGAGVLYLLRTFGIRGPGVVVAAVAYMFTPYTLDYSARISVLLLPFAALPWMIGLTRKALRDGGWRYPAAFALVVQVIGGVNATALIFAGIGPVLWIAYAWLVDREVSWRRALGVTARIGVLTLATSLWWIAGLEMQGTYGLDVLKYTETVRAVATASSPNEILRGLGYWFFYGGDRVGPWIESASQYTQRPVVLIAGYGLATLSLLAAGVLRWRHRLFFVALLVVGMIIAVGPSPYAHPTPLGAIFKAFANSSSAGLALRSTARAVPLVVLALAVLLGLGLNASWVALRRRGQGALGAIGIAVVLVLIVVNLPALFDGSYFGKNLERPEDVPGYWTAATKYLDSQGDATRVLELPGSDFASYSWGNSVDPITPGLMDRPYVARELIPYGTAGTADLLNAFDRRFQERIADPAGVAAVLRRMGIGAVVMRNDIQAQRYNLVAPREINRVIAHTPGLGRPVVFGAPAQPARAQPAPGAVEEDEVDLAAPANEPLLNPVVVYPVVDPTPIVRAESARRTMTIAGDGEGMVTVADVGLLDGAGALQYSGSFPTPAALRAAVAPDATLVVTDENRSRARIWSSVLDNVGYTEQAGEKPLVADPNDARLPLFSGEPRDALTTTQQRGIKSIQATVYGNTISYTPEDRAARALDGDVTTAWRGASLGDARGQYIRVQLAAPITTDHLNLVQPITSSRNRWITKADLIFDGRSRLSVALDASSRTAGGQTISFGPRRFSTLEIRITGVSDPRRRLFSGADGVGFAEIRLRDVHADHDVRVDEVEQMPRDLLGALGTESGTHPLIVLMSRDAVRGVPPRTDPEPAIVRAFDLPESRSFALTGSASVNPAASDTAIAAALGISSTVTATASASLAACLQCHAASAADGDPTTAWNTPFVDVGRQWVQMESRRPITFSRMDLQVVADGRHSVPTAIELEVDGAVRELTLPPITDSARENATTTVHVRFPAMSGRRVRVEVIGARVQLATRESTGDTVTAPVGIAELGIPGLRVGAAPVSVPGRCRSDLLSIDGQPVPVRVSGPASAAPNLFGLAATPCDPSDPSRVPTITLARGEHVVRTSEGVHTGVQLDRVVLASAAGGQPLAVAGGRVTGLGRAPLPAPSVTVVRNGATRVRVHVSGADDPFWLVLGQSHSDGWKAHVVHAGSLGPSHLVDGYANGWLVRPNHAAFDVVLEWTPQRQVWAAIWISVVAALACVAMVGWALVRRRRRAATDVSGDADVQVEWHRAPRRSLGTRPSNRVVLPLLAGLAATLVVAPWAGAIAVAVVVMLQWRPSLRPFIAVVPAALIAIVMVYVVYLQHHFRFPPVFEWPTLFPFGRPLGWLAVVLLALDVLVERAGTSPGGTTGPAPEEELAEM
jgi:arabinofuranan 3-O-arabinosyltransferase